jgi:hypothetical protein
MYARAKEVAEGMLGKANVKIAPQTIGGEDFAFVYAESSGCLLLDRRRQRDHHGEGAPGALAVLRHG